MQNRDRPGLNADQMGEAILDRVVGQRKGLVLILGQAEHHPHDVGQAHQDHPLMRVEDVADRPHARKDGREVKACGDQQKAVGVGRALEAQPKTFADGAAGAVRPDQIVAGLRARPGWRVKRCDNAIRPCLEAGQGVIEADIGQTGGAQRVEQNRGDGALRALQAEREGRIPGDAGIVELSHPGARLTLPVLQSIDLKAPGDDGIGDAPFAQHLKRGRMPGAGAGLAAEPGLSLPHAHGDAAARQRQSEGQANRPGAGDEE